MDVDCRRCKMTNICWEASPLKYSATASMNDDASTPFDKIETANLKHFICIFFTASTGIYFQMR